MSSRLKILHAGKFYPPVRGGIETILQQLCIGTADRWDVRAIVAGKGRKTIREALDGVEVLRMASIGQAASVPLLPTLPCALWKGYYDCVILHEPNPLAATLLALHTPSRRLVIWHHSDIVRQRWSPLIYGPVQRRLYRRAACVIVSAPHLAESSSTVRHARRIVTIPFGLRLEPYRDSNSNSARSRAIRSQFSDPIILFVGRLVYYKGVDNLIRALPQCPGTLVLVGEGPSEGPLRRLSEELGVASRVKFIGHVSDEDLPFYYHASDLLVLPSTHPAEAFGVVQIEAMACGLPVVCTNLPTAVPWVNQHEITGLVVEPGNPEALARAIRRILDDPAVRTRMGEAGRRRAAEQFSSERMIRDFIEAIEAVVKS